MHEFASVDLAMTDARRSRPPTHLFTVRLWIEPDARDGPEMRGRVQHVPSGEVIYFRTWADLVTFFEVVLKVARSPPCPNSGDEHAPQTDR